MATQSQLGFRQRRPPKASKAKVVEDTASKTKAQLPTKTLDTVPPTVVNADLEALRTFDHNNAFGPMIGMSRLERWKRAEKFGLNPDPRIKEIIEHHKDDPEYTQCVWFQFKGLQMTP